ALLLTHPQNPAPRRPRRPPTPPPPPPPPSPPLRMPRSAAAFTDHMPLDPQLLAIGLAALAGGAIGLAVLLVARNRGLEHELASLRQRTEELADRNWELKESQERARGFLEAQCDLIVRRDAQGRITYANDAFCALA